MRTADQFTPDVLPSICRARRWGLADAVTRSPLAHAVSSRQLLLPVACVLLASGIIWKSAIGGAAQAPRSDDDEFSVSVVTDSRTSRLGMATVVRAGGRNYFFDCRGIDAATTAVFFASARPAAVFVTNPAWLTEPDVVRVRDGTAGQEPPLRIWGPVGTREWMRRRYPDGPGARAEWAPTVAEVVVGDISEGDVRVTAVPVAEGTLAYRVVSQGRSVLIASNVKTLEALESMVQGVDLAVLRHSNTPDVLRLLDQVRPQQLWIVPDGLPISVAQVRESYCGPFEVVSAGLRRAVAPRFMSPRLAQR